MRLSHAILLLLSLWYGKDSVAQTGTFTATGSYRYFDVPAGLPQMQITNIIEDSHGFIWVSTKGGIARWDGDKFQTYTHSTPNYGTGMARSIIQTGDNSYLAAVGGALKRIVGKEIYNIGLPSDIAALRIDQLLRYGNDEVVISFRDKDDSGRFPAIIYNHKQQKVLEKFYPRRPFFLTKGDYLIGWKHTPDLSSQDIYLYKRTLSVDSITIRPSFFTFHANTSITTAGIRNSFYYPPKRKQGKMLIDTLYWLDVQDEKLVVKNQQLKKPLIVKEGRWATWIYLNDSSFYYQNEKDEVILQQGNTEVSYGRKHNIFYALIDREGNLWGGTEQGLYCFYKNSFTRYQFGFTEGVDDEPWSITKDKFGDYYVADYKSGVFQFNANTMLWKKITMATQGNFYDKIIVNKGTFAATALWNGSVLLPLVQGFAVKNGEAIKVFHPLPNANEVYSVSVDSLQKCAYIAMYTSAFRLNKNFTLDTLGRFEKAGLRNFMSSALLRNGKLLFGGARDKSALAEYANGKWHSLQVAVSGIHTMDEDDYRNLWIGTFDSLYCYRNDSLLPVTIPLKGILDAVKVYNKQWLIITGSEEIILLDLMQYQKGKITCYRYDHTNGFNGLECAQNSIFIDDDSTVWVAALRGTWRFDPKQLAKQTTLLKPIIEQVYFSSDDFN